MTQLAQPEADRESDDVAIATVRSETSRASRYVTFAAVIGPPIGLVAVASKLWGIALTWVDLILFAVLYVLCGLGTTVGFHRGWTIRGLEKVGLAWAVKLPNETRLERRSLA